MAAGWLRHLAGDAVELDYDIAESSDMIITMGCGRFNGWDQSRVGAAWERCGG